MAMIGGILLLVGTFFFVVGIIGILRLPDVYTRLHASGKVATVGLFALLLGGGLIMPEFLPRLLLVGLFFLLTAPAASHVIALADRIQKEQAE